MNNRELIKLCEDISIILKRAKREDLMIPLLELIRHYHELSNELESFVRGDIESTSDEEEEEYTGKVVDEEVVVQVSADGFHFLK